MSARILLVLFIAITASSCVSRFNRPDIPQCVGMSNGKVFCVVTDPNSDTPLEIEVPVKNYICTDPDSYNIMETYVDSIELRLENCLRNPKKCQ